MDSEGFQKPSTADLHLISVLTRASSFLAAVSSALTIDWRMLELEFGGSGSVTTDSVIYDSRDPYMDLVSESRDSICIQDPYTVHVNRIQIDSRDPYTVHVNHDIRNYGSRES